MGVLHEYHAADGRGDPGPRGDARAVHRCGMMIFFNDPVAVTNPPSARCGWPSRRARASCGRLERWRKRGFTLDCGVGVADGYATIGAIGFEGRWDYGAIGTVTDLAARLCGEAAPGLDLAAAVRARRGSRGRGARRGSDADGIRAPGAHVQRAPTPRG